MRIAIVGVGNLGSVVAQRLLSAGLPREQLTLVSRGSDASAARCRELGLEPHTVSQVTEKDVVILTVKPQDSRETSQAIRPFLEKQTVLLSLMAGVSVAALASATDHESIARAMPNLGAMVGESATAYYVSPATTPVQVECVEYVVATLGKSWKVASEQMIDLATAVAGSGPAYLCWLGEHIEYVAREHGLSAEDAYSIVLQTFRGSVAYLEKSSETFSQLRSRVTSPQGTTAAAVSVLSQANADTSIREAVTAAFERAKELGSLAS